MKLLFDENLSPKLPTRLSDLFPDSLHVRDIGMKATIDPIVWGASHLCKYRYNFGKKVTLATRAASAITMNPEDFKRLETCLQEAAEILYRNTPTEELTSFESIEKAVRTKMLE
ncbi:DUF5615 family PIN-like protein, partial [Nostoc sp. NZL]|uniref:DUF5615 family PIN-like protein n=1 Tax=Nostoc sp. NZL TaxID=2650612 RepID=UPI001E647DEA